MNHFADSCNHCGNCTAHCPFLGKYNIDLGAYGSREELAYHCFLCGQCRRVCPKGIDGRAISLQMREKRVTQGHRPAKDGHLLLLLEKKDYLFQNYRHAGSGTVLFPGCNFPAYFPKTTAHLSRLAGERGVGTVYDCCGKPVSELGLVEEAAAGLAGLERRLKDRGVQELVVLCPNCYYYLKERSTMKIRFIYEALAQWGLASPVDLSDGHLFLPCPDRDSLQLLGDLERHLFTGPVRRVENTVCCGAGGCAAAKEPQLAAEMVGAFARAGSGKIYTYCGTCAGRIAGGGTRTEHVLCKVLGHPETPARGIRSLWNRAVFGLR